MAKIIYCDDSEPGITRKKVRHGWGYYDIDGNRITDRDEIDRLNGIGLPPAYRDAWYCPDPMNDTSQTNESGTSSGGRSTSGSTPWGRNRTLPTPALPRCPRC